MTDSTLEAQSPKLETDLKEIAADVVRRAMAGGATAAEAVVREGDEFSALVRLGQIETLKESGSKAIGVRVFFGQSAASTYSSDFSREGIECMVKSALELAKVTSEDPYGGIPEPSQLGSLPGDLDLYYEDVYSLPGAERIDCDVDDHRRSVGVGESLTEVDRAGAGGKGRHLREDGRADTFETAGDVVHCSRTSRGGHARIQ